MPHTSFSTLCSLICFLWLSYNQNVVNGDLFTSTDDMRKLSDAELLLVPDLEDVVKKLEDKVNLLKLIAGNLRYNHQLSSDGLEIAGHPVHAYNMIKRWRHIQNVFESSDSGGKKGSVVPIQLDCKDEHSDCAAWAQRGECQKNPNYMLQACKLSCSVCKAKPSKDELVGKLLTRLQMLTGKSAPDNNDYEGAAQGIIRLQRTYKLSTKKIIEGDIYGFKSMSNLEPEDYFNLGKQALKLSEFGYAEQWLQRARKTIQDPGLVPYIDVELIKSYIGMKDIQSANDVISKAFNGSLPMTHRASCVDDDDNCIGWKDQGECEKNPTYMMNFCKYTCNHQTYCAGEEKFPTERELTNVYHVLKRTAKRQKTALTVSKPNTIRGAYDKWKPAYEKLCRGQGTKKYRDAVCRYRQALLPYYVFKEEILSMNPRIAMVYDVMSDQEGEMVKELAKNKMARAQVGTDRRISRDRVSKVGWLGDNVPFINRLTERIEMITGLEATLKVEIPGQDRPLKSADELQVVNYGIGGHYEAHTDYFEFATKQDLDSDIYKHCQSSGDRIATFLLYLTNVTVGGGTVYPRVKIYVPPVKNSAAFWFNSKLSGEYDPETLHAGCPVLLGEKWVCNKWIREFGNHFNRKCDLNKDAVYS